MTQLRFWYRLRTREKRVASAERAFEHAVSKLTPEDIAIDCGANVGDISIRLADTGATVHSFEPDPDAFRELQERLGQQENVKLYKAAVGVREGELPLYASNQRVSGSKTLSVSSSLFNESKRVSKEPYATVKVINFEKFVRTLSKPPALVKIDIEGAEIELLEHFLNVGLIKSIGSIFVETHEKQLPSLRRRTFRLIALLKDPEYENVILDWG